MFQLLRDLRRSSIYSRQERVTGRNRVINSEAEERGESDANSVASPTTLLAMLRRLLTFVAGSWCLTTGQSSLVREIATVGALLLVPVPLFQVTPRTSQMYVYSDVFLFVCEVCVVEFLWGMHVFLCVQGRGEKELWLRKSGKEKAMDETRIRKMRTQ